MKVQFNCKAVVFITDNQGLKKYYVSHFPSPGVCDSKSYASLMGLVADLNTLDAINNFWPGLSGFQSGAPNIPQGEKIVAQIGFKGCNDDGNGTVDSVVVVLKKQSQPLFQMLVLSGTPANFMSNVQI